MSKLDSKKLYEQLVTDFNEYNAIPLSLAKDFSTFLFPEDQWQQYKERYLEKAKYGVIDETKIRLSIVVDYLTKEDNARRDCAAETGYQPIEITNIRDILEAVAAGAIIPERKSQQSEELANPYEGMTKELFEEGAILSYGAAEEWGKVLYGKVSKEDRRAYLEHGLCLNGVGAHARILENMLDIIEKDKYSCTRYMLLASSDICLHDPVALAGFVNRTALETHYAVTALQKLNEVVLQFSIQPEDVVPDDFEEYVERRLPAEVDQNGVLHNLRGPGF